MSDAKSEFMCLDVDKLVKEAQVQIVNLQKRKDLYGNMSRMEFEIKMGAFVLLEKP